MKLIFLLLLAIKSFQNDPAKAVRPPPCISNFCSTNEHLGIDPHGKESFSLCSYSPWKSFEILILCKAQDKEWAVELDSPEF